jgi:hypothetical protein
MQYIENVGYLGDFKKNDLISFKYATCDGDGGSLNRTSIVDTRLYRGNSTTQSTSGITETQPSDSRVGVVLLEIDTSGSYFIKNNDYTVVLNTIVIDSVTITFCVASFSIENRVGSNPRHFMAMQKLWTPKGLLESE